MVGHRVSQAELYDDRDVIIQILKLKDTVNDYAGGIIDSIDVVGNDLVIDWADGTSVSLPLPPPTGISSVAGAVSGGNLTITFYMTDGSSHAFTTPLTGMATETYVNGLDAQNVKLTGAQTVAGTKTFSDSPVVPDTPATEHCAVNQDWADNSAYSDDTVNNLLHKSGNEVKNGHLTLNGFKIYSGKGTAGSVIIPIDNVVDGSTAPTGSGYRAVVFVAANGDLLAAIQCIVGNDNSRKVRLGIYNPTTDAMVWTDLAVVTP